MSESCAKENGMSCELSTLSTDRLSISAQMQKGNAQNRAKIRALLLDCSPKTNHHFCPPLITRADTDKTHSIYKALA